MIGKFGGKQSLEDAMIYLIVIVGVGFGITMVGAMIEDEAKVQLVELDERAAKDTDSPLAKSGYYEKSVTAKVILMDLGGWLKLIGIVVLAMGLVMMRTSSPPSKNA